MNIASKIVSEYISTYQNKNIIKYLILINSPMHMRGFIDVVNNIENQDLLSKARLISKSLEQNIQTKINEVINQVYEVNNNIISNINNFISINESLQINNYRGIDPFHGMCDKNPLYVSLLTNSEANNKKHIDIKALFLVCHIYNLIDHKDPIDLLDINNIGRIITHNEEAKLLSRFIRKTSYIEDDYRLNDITSCIYEIDYKLYFDSEKSKYSNTRKSVGDFLNVSLYKKIKKNRKGGGGHGGVRKIRRIGGFISFEGGIHANLDEENLIIEFPYSLDEEDSGSDIDDEEVNGKDILVLTDDQYPNHGRMIGRNQINHIATANQYLPCDFNILSPYEVGNLITKINTHIDESDDIHQQKSMILLLMIYVLGRSIEDIVESFHISTGEHESIERIINLIIKKDCSYFCINTKSVNNLNFKSKSGGFEDYSGYLRIPDILGISNHASKLYEESTSFFNKNKKAYISTINEFIKTHNDLNRITLTKIKNQIFHTIVNIQSSDTSIASIYTEKYHAISKTQLHYTALRAWLVEEHVISALQLNIDKAKKEGFLLKTYNNEWVPKKTNSVVGSTMMPSRKAVINSIHSIKNDLRELRNKDNEIIKFHNLYTYYTYLLLMYSSGYRAIRNTLGNIKYIDFNSNSLIIRDKDGDDGYNTRLVYIPDTTINQIKLYKKHRDFILNSLSTFPEEIWNIKDAPFLFFIDDKYELETLRPKNILNFSESYLHAPANTSRRYIRSYLVSKKIHPEYIDYFMGHWAHGQEPWGRHSTLDEPIFKAEMLKAMSGLLDDLGFHIFRGRTK